MSGPRKGSAYDAFSTVDSLVSKPIMGSDGAASWQQFQSSTKHQQSRNVAPHIPLKRADKLSGMKSIQEERRNEEKIRISGGDSKMGSGYTVFKRKGHDRGEIAERKRLKCVEERTRPEDAKYYIKAETFGGWKEDYVFTTRDRGTGYFWDGMDSVKKLKGASLPGTENASSLNKDDAEQPAKKVKKKKKKKDKKSKKEQQTAPQSDLPSGWAEAIDPTSGKNYYYNHQLNKTVWEKPTSTSGNEMQEIIKDKDGEKGSNGWEEAKDPSTGKTYNYNRSLNKTTWERPF